MKILPLFFQLFTLAFAASSVGGEIPRVRVSDNHRFLVTERGQPFFWLGDTAWDLRMLKPDEVDLYMSNRVHHGFNVVQVCCGYSGTDQAGHRPYRDGNTDTPNEAFWASIDALVHKARPHGLYIALVPMWGQEYAQAVASDAGKARRLGQWIGRRYAQEPHVLWIVSGEYDSINNFRLPISAAQKSVLDAVAQGLREGHGGRQLMTIHPGIAYTSSLDFHDAAWLDFNLLQSGHEIDREAYHHPENHTSITKDYQLFPTKPVLDGEPFYEDTPDGVWVHRTINDTRGNAGVVRRKAYWAIFAGACGHTYGHNDIYCFFVPEYPGHVRTLPKGPGQRGDWKSSLNAAGATQMKHLRALMESRPFLTRIPDQSVLAGDARAGNEHLHATRDAEGAYAMIYSPSGRPFKARMEKVTGPKVKAWWFNPRTGEATALGEFVNTGEREFTPPTSDAGNDWVLVLDDVAKNFPPPGSAKDTGGAVQPGSSAGRFKGIQVGTRPESVTKGFGGHYYVTVMGDQQPGDAVIKVVKSDQVEVFATGMDEPKGIAFVGGFLVTTDLKRVWKIDAQGNKTVLAAETDFPKAISYLNDTAAAPDGRGVFVTDMGARDKIMGPDGLWPLDSPEAKSLPHIGRIYHISLDGRVSLAVDAIPEMACPNGVCAPAQDRLLIAEFFHGNLLQARNGKLETLNTGFRGADGIESAKSGEIFVSSWTQGKVWKLDQRGRTPQVLIEGLQSAADFYLDEAARFLLVPDMKAGTIVYVPWQ